MLNKHTRAVPLILPGGKPAGCGQERDGHALTALLLARSQHAGSGISPPKCTVLTKTGPFPTASQILQVSWKPNCSSTVAQEHPGPRVTAPSAHYRVTPLPPPKILLPGNWHLTSPSSPDPVTCETGARATSSPASPAPLPTAFHPACSKRSAALCSEAASAPALTQPALGPALPPPKEPSLPSKAKFSLCTSPTLF